MAAATYEDQDIFDVSDRLENAASVVFFLSEASACLAMRDDGIPETAAHGMYLVFCRLREDLDKIQSFLRKEEPLK